MKQTIRYESDDELSMNHRTSASRGCSIAKSESWTSRCWYYIYFFYAPLITQLSSLRNSPEQGTLRRHTLDSGYIPDLKMVSGARKRTLSTLPSPHLHGKNHQQVYHHHHVSQVKRNSPLGAILAHPHYQFLAVTIPSFSHVSKAPRHRYPGHVPASTNITIFSARCYW